MCSAGDRRKLAFTLNALQSADPFADSGELPVDVRENVQWVAERTDDDIIEEREKVTREIECRAAQLWSDGSCVEWLSGATFMLVCTAESAYHPSFVVQAATPRRSEYQRQSVDPCWSSSSRRSSTKIPPVVFSVKAGLQTQFVHVDPRRLVCVQVRQYMGSFPAVAWVSLKWSVVRAPASKGCGMIA